MVASDLINYYLDSSQTWGFRTVPHPLLIIKLNYSVASKIHLHI